jgi:hypothetical protein
VCMFWIKLAQLLFIFIFRNERSIYIKEITCLEQLNNHQFLKEDPETRSVSFVLGRVLKKATISFDISVRTRILPHRSIWFRLHRLSLNLMFKNFSLICQENSSIFKIQQHFRVFTLRSTNIFDDISLISS